MRPALAVVRDCKDLCESIEVNDPPRSGGDVHVGGSIDQGDVGHAISEA
jgi:hypothetical protein